MKKVDVIRHFGTASKVAAALGISRAAVAQWGERVPEGAAYKLESITAGALRAGDDAEDSGRKRAA